MTNEDIDSILDLGIDELEKQDEAEVIDDTSDEIDEIAEGASEFDSMLEGFSELAETPITTPRDIAKNSAKFDSLSDVFGVTTDGMDEELDTMISEARGELVEHVQSGGAVTPEIKETAFNVDLLGEDFKLMRSTIRDSLADSRAIQKKFTDEMLMTTIEDISPTTLMGYSELMKAVTKQVEVLAKIYKDVADTQNKLKEYLKQEQMVEDQASVGGGTTNIQNNYILSTKDLIDKFNPKG